MRWLKIGPLLDPHLMHAVSLLGFFHRSRDRLVGLPPDIWYASRLEQNVEKMWMSLQPYLSVSQCQQLYGLERDIKHSGTLAHKFNQLLKAMVTPALVAEAQDHVAKRIHSLACPNMPNFFVSRMVRHPNYACHWIRTTVFCVEMDPGRRQ